MKRKQKIKDYFDPKISALNSFSGPTCRKVREGMGLSVAVVAAIAGVTASNVKRFEAMADLPLTDAAARYQDAIGSIEECRRRAWNGYLDSIGLPPLAF